MALLSELFSDPDVTAEFSDVQFIRYCFKVESTLAKVQANLGIIPIDAAEQIAAAAESLTVNMDRLRVETEKDGVPIIELVRQLRDHVDGEGATYVHWGATTQDIMDTALVLQIQACLSHIEATLNVLIGNLAQLADAHRHTLMAGRTHSQQALPLPFGLKAANWLAPLLRHRQRMAQMRSRVLVIQLGGAVGTLASLDQHGIAVQEALATALGLGVPLMPWHTQRDCVVELAGWLSLVTASLAKMAQDIILMAQTEIGEMYETDDLLRGGSSTMPQKRNPIISEGIIAAARTNAALLSAMHQASIQEHERGTHGWQIEWINLPQMFALSTSALNKARFLSEHLVVDVIRMRDNVMASNGLMMAEPISLALAALVGRAESKKLVAEACQIAVAENRHLADIVRERTHADLDWVALKDESTYFGSSNAFIDHVFQEANS
jgi:3-carboxy-cis,cis-muconate cycloisomerase